MQSALFELREVSDLLSRSVETGALPAIEIDLALSKLRNVYELLLIIQKSEIHSPAKPAVVPVAPPEKEITPAEELASAKKTARPKPLPPVSKPKSDPVQIIKAVPAETTGPAENLQETARKPEILGEKFSRQGKIIHDAISESSGMSRKDLSSLHQSRPLKNIEEAIGINDRFLFIKELFGGESERYTQTMTELNSAVDFNEAYRYIEQNFSWDQESEAVQKLLELVRRRHIPRQDE